MSAAPGGAVTPLPWDSGVLGRPVARVALEGAAPDAVRAALDALRASDVALAYLFGDPADAEGRALLKRAGAALVDRKTTYVRGVEPAAAAGLPAGIREHDGHWPDPAVRALALASGVHSRFHADPRMPRHVFQTIYEAWIARSVARELADVVYVACDPDDVAAERPLGMVTVGLKEGRADIGLLAVAEAARGRGVGRALVRAANGWAARRGVSVEQVVTQGHNDAACRLYEACGYAVESVLPIRHLWLDG